jgi:hypothetical protein
MGVGDFVEAPIHDGAVVTSKIYHARRTRLRLGMQPDLVSMFMQLQVSPGLARNRVLSQYKIYGFQCNSRWLLPLDVAVTPLVFAPGY